MEEINKTLYINNFKHTIIDDFIFSIVVERHKHKYIATCLELGILSMNKTIHQTIDDMNNIVLAHLEYALEHDNYLYLYHPCNQREWSDFLFSKTHNYRIRVKVRKKLNKEKLIEMQKKFNGEHEEYLKATTNELKIGT